MEQVSAASQHLCKVMGLPQREGGPVKTTTTEDDQLSSTASSSGDDDIKPHLHQTFDPYSNPDIGLIQIVCKQSNLD